MKVARVRSRTGRRRTVILADDDLQIVHIVAPRMRAAGYHTVLAFDGEQAIDAVRTHKADLLLIDLTMPKMSGFEVLERLSHITAPPIIIVLSGHRNSDDVRRVRTLGASDYILKPFEPADLSPSVAITSPTASWRDIDCSSMLNLPESTRGCRVRNLRSAESTNGCPASDEQRTPSADAQRASHGRLPLSSVGLSREEVRPGEHAQAGTGGELERQRTNLSK